MNSNEENKRKRLKALLEHGVEHNEDHRKETEEWAETAKDLNNQEVHDLLMATSEALKEAVSTLSEALEKLEEE